MTQGVSHQVTTGRRRAPASQLPPSQRPTPTTTIRLHYDTREELERIRFTDEPWDALVRRLLDWWRRSQGVAYEPPSRSPTSS